MLRPRDAFAALRENGDFVTADAIVDTLIAELKNSKSEDVSVVALRGIANGGNSKAFDTVEPFLKEPSRRLREAAVESIRLMSEPRVETVLLSALANETDQSIRVAAIDPCGMRDMSPEQLKTVTSVGISGKSSRVRQHALQVLATWAPRHSRGLEVRCRVGIESKRTPRGRNPLRSMSASDLAPS